MAELIEIMKDCGLTNKEAMMYLTLLELGSSKSGELMKTLGYYSKTIYHILNKLIEYGLVSYVIKSNIKYFEATDPNKFLDMLKEQEENIKLKEKQVEKIIPKLKEIREMSKPIQEANVYSGKKGMKSIFEDMLKESKEILVFGGGGKFREYLDTYSEIWHKKRIKKKIKLRVLWNENLISKKEEAAKYKYLEIKFLPKEFDNPAPAIIYKDKVAITLWSETPIATLIRSKEVAKTHKSYFELLWKQAKP